MRKNKLLLSCFLLLCSISIGQEDKRVAEDDLSWNETKFSRMLGVNEEPIPMKERRLHRVRPFTRPGGLLAVVHGDVDSLLQRQSTGQGRHHMVFAPAIAELLELFEQILRVLGRQVGDEIARAVAILPMTIAAEADTLMAGIETGLTALIISHDGL